MRRRWAAYARNAGRDGARGRWREKCAMTIFHQLFFTYAPRSAQSPSSPDSRRFWAKHTLRLRPGRAWCAGVRGVVRCCRLENPFTPPSESWAHQTTSECPAPTTPRRSRSRRARGRTRTLPFSTSSARNRRPSARGVRRERGRGRVPGGGERDLRPPRQQAPLLCRPPRHASYLPRRKAPLYEPFATPPALRLSQLPFL